MKTRTITILGAGSWGTALAILLNTKKYPLRLWMRSEEQYNEIRKNRTNHRYLPDLYIPDHIQIYKNIIKAIEDSHIIVLAIPTQRVGEIIKKIKPYIKENQIIVNVAKGIEEKSQLRISEIVNKELPNQPYAILSGPSHAEEVVNNIPTTIVVSSKDQQVAAYIQDLFTTPTFRVYTNPDLIGVELGGALKNVIAFGAGIADGLGFGDNTKAALMTRGITEISRLGRAMGANESTFDGLSGIGDLIVTCTSIHSRNRRAGILIGRGRTLTETLEEVGMVVEGVTTTKVAYNLSKIYNIEMPITEEIYKVIYENKDPKKAVMNLMTRSYKHEIIDTKEINK